MVSMNQLALSSLLLSWSTNASLAFTISSAPKTLSRKLTSSIDTISTTGTGMSTLVLQASANDDFDPLLSPHAYPKGTPSSSESESNTEETQTQQEEDEEEWSPMKLNSVKKDFQGASTEEYNVEKSSFTRQWSTVSTTSSAYNEEEEEAAVVPVPVPVPVENFDPLLSPHAYAKGTTSKPMVPTSSKSSQPSTSTITPKQPIGILLIDHGSKRPTSNQRLEILREMYENSPNTPEHYTIKAAHMEIAAPSIQEQMEEFYNEGVKKIVCHPYFLSPGRHVLEDIPVLIREAEEYLEEKYGNGNGNENENENENGDYELEVLLTEPVGSKLELMIGLIGSMVQEALGEDDKDLTLGDDGMDAYESGFVPKGKDSSELGGFLGEVKRMMDEQLD